MDRRPVRLREHLVETVVAASNLIDELRQQYILAIEAANGREWRRLDVRVRRRRNGEGTKRIFRRVTPISRERGHPTLDNP